MTPRPAPLRPRTIGLALLAASCAPDIIMSPVVLRPLAHAPAQYVVTAPATGLSSVGFTSTLGAGTVLEEVGTVPSGLVLRPLNAVLTAQGANIAQADAVVSDGRWTGFYLPVQHSLSPLRTPVPIMLEKRP